jgi:hypothetical protein
VKDGLVPDCATGLLTAQELAQANAQARAELRRIDVGGIASARARARALVWGPATPSRAPGTSTHRQDRSPPSGAWTDHCERIELP